VASIRPADRTHAQVSRELRERLASGARLLPAGGARGHPGRLFARGYNPRHRLELFGTDFYLTGVRQNADIRFFVSYVAQGARIHPRIFYKDISLVWRSASHYIRSASENWIGKGDVKTIIEDGEELEVSDEATTDLPLEMQTALEMLVRCAKHIPHDETAVGLVLRRAPDHRIEPYRDFVEPRQRAWANPRNRIHGGRKVARFTRRNDPSSLAFVRGFEPDFARGVIERASSTSRLYGGRLRRFRIVSRNKRAQYLFIAGPRQVWIGAAQGTTTELSSFGLRTIDLEVDEDLLLPGYEYHFVDEDEDPPELVSQIPKGFAGPPSEVDSSRCDASPWLDLVPVIRAFRRQVLGGRQPRR
jgi:hypothetical protein